MKKKTILVAAIAVMLVAALVVGGTLAYFTDTKTETNTFTTGKVSITLNEENADGTPFTQNQKLLPGSQTKNNIAKRVTITNNTGSEEAYVWLEELIPKALDSTDGSTGTNNIIHINTPGSTWDKYREDSRYWADGQTKALPLEQTWDLDPEEELASHLGPEGFAGTETIDGVVYNKYIKMYHGKLAAGEETTLGMSQVYMDSKVDTNAQGQYTINGKVIDYDFTKGVNIIVRAYAIQADGFADVYAAYKGYHGI